VTHVPFDRIINDTDALIAEHKIFGCAYIGLGMMPAQFFGSRENVLAFTKQINPAAKKIHDAGLRFVYHNHCPEFEKYDGQTVMDILAENTEYVGFLVDTYWVQAGGADPSDFILKYKDLIDIVHLKDFKMNGWEKKMAAVGDGNLNWVKILSACEQAGVKWLPVEHDDAEDAFGSLTESLGYLKRFENVII